MTASLSLATISCAFGGVFGQSLAKVSLGPGLLSDSLSAYAKTSMIISQKVIIGSPSIRRAASRATISDSVEECDTAVCFLQSAQIGAKVF